MDSFELEPEEGKTLESAMREALEVVERSRAAVSRDAGESLPEVDIVEEEENSPDLVAALRDEMADLRDRTARTLADFDNYRKRMDRERGEERKFAGFDVLRDLLGVVDNLERAAAADGSLDDLKTGVEMILKQLAELMGGHGVQRILALGERFDPSLHEAVARHADPAVDAPTVDDELQSGYLLHERLLRPAVVKVALPPEPAERDESDDDGGRSNLH